MKVFVVMSLARQHLGDYCFLRAEKAFSDPAKAEGCLKTLKDSFTDSSGRYKTISLSTPNGDAECYCEAGLFELEVE